MIEMDSTLILMIIKKLYEELVSKKDPNKTKYLLDLVTRYWMLLEHSYFYIMDILLYWHFIESGNLVSEDERCSIEQFKRG